MEEIIFDIKRSHFLYFLTIFQFVICLCTCVISVIVSQNVETEKVIQDEKYVQEKLYDITDNLVGKYETDFFSNGNGLAKLKLFYAALANNENFKYLEVYENSIVLFGNTIADIFLIGYETGESEIYRGKENNQILNEIKCFWISRNVSEHYDFKYDEGSIWTDQETESGKIPILLGYEYHTIYQIGDSINGIDPVHRECEYEVVGILEKGAYVNHNNRMYNLDRYVLIPLANETAFPMNKEEESRQKILYLFKINGMLKSNLSANELQDIIQILCEDAGIIPSSTVTGATNYQSYILNVSMIDIMNILKQITSMLIIFSLLTAMCMMWIKIEKSQKYISILYLNGFSRIQILLIIFGNILIPIIFADMIASILILLLFEALKDLAHIVILLILLNFIILGCGLFVSILKMNHLDIIYRLGEEE